MKKSSTYRVITVAIGILVAVVVALTLWTRTPDATSITRGTMRPEAEAFTKRLIHTTIHLLTETSNLREE